MCDYRKLNIPRENLSALIDNFCTKYQLSYSMPENHPQNDDSRFRVTFTSNDTDKLPALVDLYYVNDGTTTVNYRIGKNQELGKKLAEFLKKSVREHSQSIFLTIRSIEDTVLQKVIDSLKESEIGFKIEANPTINEKLLFNIKSQYNDRIKVTLYQNNTLLIQGKPLYAYVRFTRFLAKEQESLLEQVADFKRENEGGNSLLSDEEAESNLRKILPHVFDHISGNARQSLIAAERIPTGAMGLEYSMLLYNYFRFLESTIKTCLSSYGLKTDSIQKPIGYYFNQKSAGSRRNEWDNISNQLEVSLKNAYAFYDKQRHTYFHGAEVSDTTSVIDNIEVYEGLKQELVQCVEHIYLTWKA
tara:strand:+ start:5500 stop:6576 length:1077 start_codon:yes stop_codon:yes gene_type:complete